MSKYVSGLHAVCDTGNRLSRDELLQTIAVRLARDISETVPWIDGIQKLGVEQSALNCIQQALGQDFWPSENSEHIGETK